MTDVILSLAPFQILIYIFPTILFFISLIARLILRYSANKNSLESIFQFAENIINELRTEETNIKDIGLSQLVNKVYANINSRENNQRLIKNNTITIEDRKQRDSHFLFGFYIDAFALSIANGVIIMFQTLNLLYGFILLFIGVVLGLFGFALIFTSRIGLATFLSTVIVFAFFTPEMLFLITSSLYWFKTVPIMYSIATIAIAVLAISSDHYKKSKVKKRDD